MKRIATPTKHAVATAFPPIRSRFRGSREEAVADANAARKTAARAT
jgi:hypothetical protein